MNEKEKKNPRLPAWKVWILIIAMVQALTAIQNCWFHHQCIQNRQLLWDSINQQAQIVNEHIENTNQYLTDLNKILEPYCK